MKLDLQKSGRYAELKAHVTKGIMTIFTAWEDVGNWLHEIREKELYLHDREQPCASWGEFCDRVLKFSRRKADQCIQSAKVAQTLGEVFGQAGGIAPQLSESATRQLADVPPEKAVEVIQRATAASGGKKPTAAKIKAAKAVTIDAATGLPEPKAITSEDGNMACTVLPSPEETATTQTPHTCPTCGQTIK